MEQQMEKITENITNNFISNYEIAAQSVLEYVI